MSGVVAGSLERKQQLLEVVFGIMRSRQGSDCHVATSPRRDVTTSRRHHVATSPRRDVTTSRRHHVATSPRRDVTTSRRHHVATSPRRDVTTSRRHHVATSPRRDVSSKICTSSFKVQMAQKLGHREAYERRHGFPEQSDIDFEEVPGTCTAFHFFGYFRILEQCFLY